MLQPSSSRSDPPQTQNMKANTPLFWFTAAPPVAIIGIGINFILNPVGASAGYGVPCHHPPSFPFMWIKGIRDIFSGLVLLWSLWNGDRHTTASLNAFATLIAVGDGFVILNHLGVAPPLMIHWGTALYMSVVTWFLFRKDPKSIKSRQ